MLLMLGMAFVSARPSGARNAAYALPGLDAQSHSRSRGSQDVHSRSAWSSALLLLTSTSLSASDASDLKPLRAGLKHDYVLEADARRDETPACWRLLCKDMAPRELVCDATALHQIVEMQASPDQRHLAVMSVGEGHPILEIIALQLLLEKGNFQSTCTLNPYPGTIWVTRWQQGSLQIGSDVDLQSDSSELRAETMEAREYRVSPTDCRLSPLVAASAKK